MREPYAVKIARTVPGRGEGGNTLSLFARLYRFFGRYNERTNGSRSTDDS